MQDELYETRCSETLAALVFLQQKSIERMLNADSVVVKNELEYIGKIRELLLVHAPSAASGVMPCQHEEQN